LADTGIVIGRYRLSADYRCIPKIWYGHVQRQSCCWSPL